MLGKPGSRWWRVDLHAHPVSYDFNEADPENGLDKLDYRRDAGIQAIAVTAAAAVTSLRSFGGGECSSSFPSGRAYPLAPIFYS